MILSAILRLLVVFVTLGSSSIVIYLSIRSYLVPSNVIFKEPLYFDFSISQPKASVTLLAEEKQWTYTADEGTSRSIKAKRQGNKRFLLPFTAYIISLDLTLAKSPRNRELSKFMINMKTIDRNGTEVAKSSRPIIIPYQSRLSKAIEGLLTWPFRFLGLYSISESFSVREDMMNNYK